VVGRLSQVLEGFVADASAVRLEPTRFVEDGIVIDRLRGLGYLD
jgi:hypothetical protein